MPGQYDSHTEGVLKMSGKSGRKRMAVRAREIERVESCRRDRKKSSLWERKRRGQRYLH